MRQHGVITTYSEDMVTLLETGTLSCVHCGMPFEVGPGKLKGRGWCGPCHGYYCGPCCRDCVPIEVRLANLEAGRPELTPKPAQVTSGWEPWRKGANVLIEEWR